MGAPPAPAVSGEQDVAVVGGGIAGASLAAALAAEGFGVVVLEATTEFTDRVRGEGMHVWGVLEARRLGVEQALLDAGAHVASLWQQYTEGAAEPRTIPMGLIAEGVAGSLNLRHPVACQALLDEAEARGATVVRGVGDVGVAPGDRPRVSWRVGDRAGEVEVALVVGADGRRSAVRRQVGIPLERDAAITYISGLLVDGLHRVPDDHDVMAGEGDRFFILFHQGDGRARAYQVTGASQRGRFAGRDAAAAFLRSVDLGCYPWSAEVAAAVPAGPCATYPGEDTWTGEPFAPGVVLVGDAAGYNDPIIGEGLSIAMRDARTVRDLVVEDGPAGADFHGYGEERLERMRRLRLIADVLTVVHVEDGAENRAARRAWLGERMATMDPEVFPLLLAAFAGPETVPDELVDDAILARIRDA